MKSLLNKGVVGTVSDGTNPVPARKSTTENMNGSLEAYLGRRFNRSGGNRDGHAWELYFAAIDSVEADAQSRGLDFINFSNYDYLGLAKQAAPREAAVEAIRKLGTGALGSRLVGGERLIHRELEANLATFVGTEAALVFVSGYLTNETLISSLLQARDLVLYDELSHASILAGVRNARATCMPFRHNDTEHLHSLLDEVRQKHQRCLIVTEGLYSMDGDIPDLPAFVDLKHRYDAWLMVDESHSHGVLGIRGRGICEHFALPVDEVDLSVGTLSKSFASCGGFIAAKKNVCDVLRLMLPGFVYSVGLPPSVAASANAAVQQAIEEPWRVERLSSLTQRLKTGFQAAGFDTGPAVGLGIVPVYFDDDASAIAASRDLMVEGIYVPPIVRIAIPSETPRLRFFVTAGHDENQIDRAISVLVSARSNDRLKTVG